MTETEALIAGWPILAASIAGVVCYPNRRPYQASPGRWAVSGILHPELLRREEQRLSPSRAHQKPRPS